MDIVWGDADAHSVSIDEDDQAWIDDLSGGSMTETELKSNSKNEKRESEMVGGFQRD